MIYHCLELFFFFPFPRVCVMCRTCLWRCLRTGPSWKSTLWTRSGRTPGSGRRTWTKRSTIRTTAARWTSTRITSWTACTNHDSAHRPTHQRTNRSPPSHQTPHFSLVMLHLIPSTPLSRQQAQTPFFLHGLMDHSNVQFFSIAVVLNQVLNFSSLSLKSTKIEKRHFVLILKDCAVVERTSGNFSKLRRTVDKN